MSQISLIEFIIKKIAFARRGVARDSLRLRGSLMAFISEDNVGQLALKQFTALGCMVLPDAMIGLNGRTLEREAHTDVPLTATHDLLLPKLMSGEIRVKDAGKIAVEVA